MIHVFHGFLGSPSDFDFLADYPGVKIHDLYREDLNSLKNEIEMEDILIGYSMGGRIALQLAFDSGFQVKKLVLINAHPGLEEKERQERAKWEEEVVHRLQESTPEEFLAWWNALPVFQNDEPIKGNFNRERSLDLFHRMRLSEQPNFLPKLSGYREKVLWIIGKQDAKYRALAEGRLKDNHIPFIMVEGGHRLFQHPRSVLQALQSQAVI
jgi:2-succinyl-6-hydroxy-2,4-cyclohexadiene-1-carboxylate synthase